jgi:Aspartyl protease
MTRMRGSCPRDPIRCPRTLAAKGGAELLDQPLLVLPLPRFVTDRGNRPALAGVVGYELLARFAVRTDYDHRMLTLTPAPDFHYQAGGKRVPLVFVNKHPVVSAAVDGIAGKFEIDTGSSAALVLQRKFVEQHGLEARHPGGLRMKSGGIDGVFETVITRVDRFGIADAEIARPAAEFPEEGRSGTPLTEVDGSWHRIAHASANDRAERCA